VTVYLVGAGPGDPGLLTRRGADLLARADVVIFDRLIDQSLLGLAPPGAERIDAGKRPAGTEDAEGTGTARQREINELLVATGRRAEVVVRLKGGDPFLFGRGGEEAEVLRAAGVPYEVVPGVTSAVAVPAYAGIPVTHRGMSTSVTVVTGQVGDPSNSDGVDWESLARAGGTLVILMGVATRAEIARRLQAAGRPPGTPVAATVWGTTGRERTVRTTLAGLAGVELASPAVIVVGAVAGLDLTSPGSRPLAGWTVVVTRPAEQASGLRAELEARGAGVLAVPAIAVADPLDAGAALADAAARVAGYDWVAFTSANAVHRLMAHLADARAFGRVRLAVVGRATAAALAGYRLVADLVPDEASGAGLAAAFEPARPGGRVLFPRAEAARDSLPAGLRARGWTVDEVVAYRTVTAPPPDDLTASALGQADVLTFASPSAVAAWTAWQDELGSRLVRPPVVACLGPVTRDAARAAGMAVAVESDSPSDRALVAALVAARTATRADPDA